jgi:ABC-type multidrug transport system fused ATPase/permease subunit
MSHDYIAYILLGNQDLSVAKALTSLALFDMLRFPLFMLPNVINNVIEAKISVDRVSSLLLEPDCCIIPKTLSNDSDSNRHANDAIAVMKSATFVWEGSSTRKKRVPKVPTIPLWRQWQTRFLSFTVNLRQPAGQQLNAPGNAHSHVIAMSNDVSFVLEDKSDAEFFADIVDAQQQESEQLINNLEQQVSWFHRHWLVDHDHNTDNNSQLTQHSDDYIDKPRPKSTSSGDRVLTLYRINLVAPAKHLLAIIGGVGSGKSSLLSGFLGDIRLYFGAIALNSQRIAYVGQRPFIQNATVRDNILFGLAFHENKYRQVIEQCCLEADLAILPAGDMTEIGEKGINISGGQKSRVALARAVYSEAQVFLLDDPLSAVDAHVGQHLFERCILPLRDRGACVIMVTNALQYLKSVDQIIVLQDGRVVDCGSYHELLADTTIKASNSSTSLSLVAEEEKSIIDQHQQHAKKFTRGNGVFAELMKSYYSSINDSSMSAKLSPATSANTVELASQLSPKRGLSTNNETTPTTSKSRGSETAAADSQAGKLTTSEDREVGSVNREVYRKWFNAAGGLWVAATIFFFVCSTESTNVLSGWWISQFSSSYSR